MALIGMHITQMHFMTGHKYLIVRPPLRHHCQNLVNRLQYVSTRSHGVTLQKTVILIFARVINSNFACLRPYSDLEHDLPNTWYNAPQILLHYRQREIKILWKPTAESWFTQLYELSETIHFLDFPKYRCFSNLCCLSRITPRKIHYEDVTAEADLNQQHATPTGLSYFI
jgi:hypothetical protein